MTQTNKEDVRDVVQIRVQAGSAEIEDLVDVIVGRLEEAGLVLIKKESCSSDIVCQENISQAILSFVKAHWLR